MANLADKFNRSWKLLVCSFQVIFQNKQLLLFPLISFFCSLVFALFFIIPIFLIPSGHPWSDSQHWIDLINLIPGIFIQDNSKGAEFNVSLGDAQQLTATVYCAVLYLLSMAVATFFNVAFYNEIIKALAGEQVSIAEGFKFARKRIRSILLWSLFAGLVGMIIQALEQRSGWIGRIILGFVGMAWSVACVFVIPVMIREESANPITLLQNSAATLKKTWGESIIGYVGMNFGEGIVFIVSLGLGLASVMLSVYLDIPALCFAFLAVLIPALLVFIYFSSVARHVYRCALYVYASEGVVPSSYSAELMDGAWKVKKA